jgi:hypothetical protein
MLGFMCGIIFLAGITYLIGLKFTEEVRQRWGTNLVLGTVSLALVLVGIILFASRLQGEI